MKTLALMILCSVTCHFCFGQNKSNLDSLKLALAHATSDTMQVLIYDELMDAQHDRKKQIEFGLQGFNLAKRIHYDKGIMLCGNKVALKMAFDGSYEAIAILLEIKQVAERANNKMELATTLYNLGYAFGKFDKQKGFNYYMLCKNLMEKEGITEDSKHQISLGFGFWYKDDGKHLDSALFYLNKSNQLALKLPTYSPRPNQLLMYFGEVYYKKGQKDLAMNYFRQAVANDANEKAYTYRNIAYIFRDRSQLDFSA